MKKVLLTAIAVFAFGFANAQEVKFGAKAALDVSTLSDSESKALIGFQVGGFAEIKLTDKFALQPELLFSTQGGKFEDSENYYGFNTTTKVTTRLNYINLPIMAKYFATEKLSFEFGPQVGFLVSANSKIENSSTFMGKTETTNRDVDVKSSVTSTTFGLNVGAGFDVTKNINVGLRYNLGLTKVNKNSISGESDTKNNVFSLSLGYKF
ncbi:porin family protein [Flavobacterium psychrophilum]|uniref:porin family protein n=1 Tax=Flavobacterium psychrophilum TaxID=96345 RepID=UPI000B7C36B6|nr:porin family protein [Flavobacterium psychrophilum]MCB6229727.1 PorT family protein [Flavobacterium psychrophilum]SNA67108.1 conserved exported hypothetical protein [Flavobacterium psychrophilum]